MKSFFEILKRRQVKKFNKSVFKKVLTILILVLVPLAVFTLITSKTPILGGIRSFAVLTGSMNPTFDAGSVIFTQRLSSYQKGDVIAFEKDQVTITHRITDVQEKSGEIFYQTKGDANNAVDSELVSPKNVLGKEVVAVPYIGRFVLFLRTLPGFILFIILPSLIFIGLEILNIKKEMVKEIEKKFQQKLEEATKNTPKLVLLGVFILTGLLTLNNTYAYFSDSGTSSSNTFTASNSFPSSTPGPGDVVINEINWGGSNVAGAAGAADEWIELRNTTSNTIDLSNWVVVNLGAGAASTVTIPSGKTIAANGFFLISHYAETNAASALNVTPDLVIGTAISLVDTGEQLTLKTSSSGTTIDTANQAGAWFAGTNVNPIKSMERKTPPSDGTQSGNWQTATTHTNMDGSGSSNEFGTPKAANP